MDNAQIAHFKHRLSNQEGNRDYLFLDNFKDGIYTTIDKITLRSIVLQ